MCHWTITNECVTGQLPKGKFDAYCVENGGLNAVQMKVKSVPVKFKMSEKMLQSISLRFLILKAGFSLRAKLSHKMSSLYKIFDQTLPFPS